MLLSLGSTALFRFVIADLVLCYSSLSVMLFFRSFAYLGHSLIVGKVHSLEGCILYIGKFSHIIQSVGK